MNERQNWETVIGLEVHIQLLTQSKLFSGASTQYGAIPNTSASVIDLGMPGTLPVLNEEAVRMAIMFGLSINANIAKETVFSRKHYFYPDLPKGYQISQHEHPIVGSGGYLMIQTETGQEKKINITRAHLEEDAGKSLHGHSSEYHFPSGTSGIDLNRAGIPLLEIVSEPDLRTVKEVITFLKTLHTLVCYLKICDGNMQEGSFRCDANVSVRKSGETILGARAELKNLNSFRFIEKAISFEVERQIKEIEKGNTLYPETRLYDEISNQTRSLRAKEAVADYRYFQDPDLCPLPISKEWIENILHTLPELPFNRKERFEKQYTLTSYEASVLTANRDIADYFEVLTQRGVSINLAASWIMKEFSAALNMHKSNVDRLEIPVDQIVLLLTCIDDEILTRGTAKLVFEKLWLNSTLDIMQLIKNERLTQITDDHLIMSFVQQVLSHHPHQVNAYRNGKVKLFSFFIGQVMARSHGQCHPEKLNTILKQALIEPI